MHYYDILYDEWAKNLWDEFEYMYMYITRTLSPVYMNLKIEANRFLKMASWIQQRIYLNKTHDFIWNIIQYGEHVTGKQFLIGRI
jgi:predicted DNA-binding protein (MmcQ/YjbR family)